MRGSKPEERRGDRQRGTKNKLTPLRERAQAQAVDKIVNAFGAGAFAGDMHALLMSVYKDSSQPIALRVDAAQAAIGYEKPRLASVDGKFDTHFSFSEIIRELRKSASL